MRSNKRETLAILRWCMLEVQQLSESYAFVPRQSAQMHSLAGVGEQILKRLETEATASLRHLSRISELERGRTKRTAQDSFGMPSVFAGTNDNDRLVLARPGAAEPNSPLPPPIGDEPAGEKP